MVPLKEGDNYQLATENRTEALNCDLRAHAEGNLLVLVRSLDICRFEPLMSWSSRQFA